MAIAFDANLGATDGSFAGASTVTLTTTAPASAGARVIVIVSYFHATVTVSGVTIAGSAAVSDKAVANGSDKFSIWSLHSAAGVASGASIVVTAATGGGGVLVGAVSFTGILTSSALDTTASATGTGTSWSSGAATNAQADSLFIGGAGNETATTASSTAANGTEIHDRWRSSDQQGFVSGYTIAATIASRSVTGTFSSSSTATTGGLAVYKAAVTTLPPEVTMAPRIPSY